MAQGGHAVEQEGPIVLPIESGVVRLLQLMGAERGPAYVVGAVAIFLCYQALSGQWAALKGLWLCAMCQGFLILMFRRDPQYWAIMWRREWTYRMPSKLYAAPGICAKPFPKEASCPVRGQVGVYVD